MKIKYFLLAMVICTTTLLIGSGCIMREPTWGDCIDDGTGSEYPITHWKISDSAKSSYNIPVEDYGHPCNLSVDKMKGILKEFHAELEKRGYSCEWYKSEGFAAGLVKSLAMVSNHEWIEVERRDKLSSGQTVFSAFMKSGEMAMEATGKGKPKYNTATITEQEAKNRPDSVTICCVKKGNLYGKVFYKNVDRWDGGHDIKTSFESETATNNAIRFWYTRSLYPAYSEYIDIPID